MQIVENLKKNIKPFLYAFLSPEVQTENSLFVKNYHKQKKTAVFLVEENLLTFSLLALSFASEVIICVNGVKRYGNLKQNII